MNFIFNDFNISLSIIKKEIIKKQIKGWTIEIMLWEDGDYTIEARHAYGNRQLMVFKYDSKKDKYNWVNREVIQEQMSITTHKREHNANAS